MESYLDKELLEKLQAEIIENARKHYSEKVIDRWLNPRNFGIIENSQGYAKAGANCCDTIEMFLRIKDDKILEARFLTEGCGPTLAAGKHGCRIGEWEKRNGSFQDQPKDDP